MILNYCYQLPKADITRFVYEEEPYVRTFGMNWHSPREGDSLEHAETNQ